MKLGTFVGKKFLEITSDERKYIAAEINHAIKDSDIQIMEVEMKEGSPVTNMVFFTLTLPTSVSVEYRDNNGNTYLPKKITVSICKQAGYDEAVHGRCYEWEDGYQPGYDITSFSCTVDMIGDFRRYRSKTVSHNVGVTKTGYSYGTELEDLNCKDDVKRMINFIKSSRKNNRKSLI